MIFCANNLHPQLHKILSKVDDLHLLPEIEGLYEGIRNHADLLLCPTEGPLFISQEISPYITTSLKAHKIEASIISKTLETSYPGTTLLNVLITPTHLICNTKFTCPELIHYANNKQLITIHVNQAYTRCTTLHLGNNIFLTDDPGIHKVLVKHKLTSYRLEPGHVQLKDHPSGFIGGSAGIIDGTIYFNGDITHHPSHPLIVQACQQALLKISYVPNQPLVDIGSILYY